MNNCMLASDLFGSREEYQKNLTTLAKRYAAAPNVNRPSLSAAIHSIGIQIAGVERALSAIGYSVRVEQASKTDTYVLYQGNDRSAHFVVSH